MGDNPANKLTVLSDREEATFRITFADETKLPIDILMSEFIEIKSPKAKGKRFATWEVAKIEDITPEPEPVDEECTDDGGDDGDTGADGGAESQETTVVDVPFTITNEVPESSKPVEEQLTLF